MVSYIANGKSIAARRTLNETSLHSTIAVSAITQGELLYGLARNPQATKVRLAVHAVLANVEILPWNSDVATLYGSLRAEATAAGLTLSPLDMLIAAHAFAMGATLVTRDKAFSQIEALRPIVNWATDL